MTVGADVVAFDIVSWLPCQQEEQQQSLVQQLKQQCSVLAVVAPLASTTIVQASSSTQAEVYYGLAKAIDVSMAQSLLQAMTGISCSCI